MKHFRIIICLFCLLLSAAILRGQNISYKLYTPHDGLPQSQILCMFQDSRGYIWVGTHYGIAYFNGAKFQSITPKDGLPYAGVQQIQEDAKGNIWFYTGKWFCKYDGQKITYDTANIRVHDGVFFFDKSNVAWCIDARDHFIYKSTDLKNWECVSCNDKGLLGKKWHSMRYDKIKDRILLRGLTGFSFIYTKEGLNPILQKGVWFNQNGVSNSEIKFGTVADSILLLEDYGVKFLRKTNASTPIDVIQRPNGRFYFITGFGKYLYSFKDQSKIDSFPLNVASTNLIFEDKNKNVWIGTEEGLLRVYTEGFTNFDKKQLNSIWAIADDTEGGMWFGSYFETKTMWYLKDGQLSAKSVNYNVLPKKYGDLNQFGQFYFGGGRDTKGNLYFPMGWGIMKYDGKKFSVFDKATNEEPISMFFHLDKEKNLIVSGTKGGVNVVDLQTGATKYYGADKGMHPTSYVLGVGKDGTGNYWLGANNGMAKLDLSRDSITKNYTRDLKNFRYYGVNAVFGDFKGNIWAGCSQGLLRYDVKGDSFALVGDKIIRSTVNALSAYKDKYLVAAASDGVYFLDLQAFYTPEGIDKEGKTVISCFNQHNGYLGIEPNQNCLYVDSKDNVWVAASDIVTKITPSELDMNPKPLTPYITSINNEKIPYELYQQVIPLHSGVNTAKIFFEAVGFERPFNTEFSYKLDNEQWSKWLSEDFAVLDNMSSGTHTFFVRTRPAGTVDEKDIKETFIRFKIDIPFYRESYFPVLAAFGLLLIGFGSWFLIRREQQHQEEAKRQHQTYIKQQEVLEKERSRQIKYLQIQTLQAQLNPHFIFGVLQAIQTRVYQDDRDTASKLVVNLANLMRRFLESSISSDMSRIRNSEISLNQEISLLKSYIEFEQLQFSNRFDYIIHVDEDIDAENVQVPPMLIQPYVENAIKHGILYEKERRCTIELSFKKTDDDRLVCIIADNGVGRKRAKEIQESFIRMYKSRSTQILSERIKIMQELGLGISVDTYDNPVGGTIVELKIDM